MAKKKKTQLKPVARGFATTSVPKKASPLERSEDDPDASNDLPAVEREGERNAVIAPPVRNDEIAEEQILQSVVDKLQERTEKEIVRSLRAIDQDRRSAKTFPSLDLDPAIVEQIITLSNESRVEDVQLLDEPEDKAIARLGITYGVLRRLGFSDARVDQCLQAVQGIELDEAYEWLLIHCTEEELYEQRFFEGNEPKSSRTPSMPQTPRTPAGFLIPSLPGNPALDRSQTESELEAPPAARTQEIRSPSPWQSLATSTSTAMDVFDDMDDEELANGGLLGILENIPSTIFETNGKTILIRDMALPQHWSGPTPRKLLREKVTKTDKYATINYKIVSGASRAKRASVSILREGREMDHWTMGDVACYDDLQAEEYIATIALHALTFPPTEGFASSFSAISSGQPSFRLLPAVHRDLWDELEGIRKSNNDGINREIWARLRSIVSKKLHGREKATKIIKQSTGNDISRATRSRPSIVEVVSEQLVASFKARQATTEYKEKLVQRNLLPIARYRDQILHALEASQVLVLSGETGCGKSTQVPVFVLEHELSRRKYCKIYCTEPRRISAISLANRVSYELGDPPNAVGTTDSLVGYSVRLESGITQNTRLAFITNGIALRMLEAGSGQDGQGTAFDEVTHIIIDEVHERTIESDFLLIVLKSLLAQRADLRVILMSATADAEKISTYFGGCSMLHVPGRTFPVESRFLEDAVQFTGWTITESSPYARHHHDKFYQGRSRPDWAEETPIAEDFEGEKDHKNVSLGKWYALETAATVNLLDERLIPYDLILRILERICFEDPSYMPYSTATLIFLPGLAEIRRLNDMLCEHHRFGDDELFKLYPLHSTLSNENQGAVFEIPSSGVRKIVMATNIAETGITIPDITCVIDTGKHREMRFDEKRQISRLVETYIAKSNAAQRRGRAGRVRNGLCFHLFTKLRHDTQMADQPSPEMMRLSLSDLALRIKIMKVNLGPSIEDVLSRALDPPTAINVQRAVSMLVEVRALTPSEEITPMGRLLSKLPTDVHLGKFLLTAALFRCLDPALTIAAALNSKSPFVSPFGYEEEADRAKQSFKIENSDFLTIHNAFASWRRISGKPRSARQFCRTNYLSHQNLQQIEELRQQFLGYLIDSSFIRVDRAFTRELSRARYTRARTRFVPVPAELDTNSDSVALIHAALTAGLFPKILAANNEMRTISNNQQAYIHPSSVNFSKKSEFGVNHLVYFTLMQTRKLYAWETGPVDDLALLLLCGECDFKLLSGSALIDRKIKFRIPTRSLIALKALRSHLGPLLSQQFRGKTLTETQSLWKDVAMVVLGRIKVNAEGQSGLIVR